jgi:hypothetical protein
MLGACGSAIMMGIAADDGPVWRSLDRGATWRRVDGVTGASAVAFDPTDPSWVAVATFERDTLRASIRISHNSGETWMKILTQSSSEADGLAMKENVSRIVSLSVSSTGARQLLAVSGRGVYLVKCADSGLAH